MLEYMSDGFHLFPPSPPPPPPPPPPPNRYMQGAHGLGYATTICGYYRKGYPPFWDRGGLGV